MFCRFSRVWYVYFRLNHLNVICGSLKKIESELELDLSSLGAWQFSRGLTETRLRWKLWRGKQTQTLFLPEGHNNFFLCQASELLTYQLRAITYELFAPPGFSFDVGRWMFDVGRSSFKYVRSGFANAMPRHVLDVHLFTFQLWAMSFLCLFTPLNFYPVKSCKAI